MQAFFDTLNDIFKTERESCSECGAHITKSKTKAGTWQTHPRRMLKYKARSAWVCGEVAKIRAEMREEYNLGGM